MIDLNELREAVARITKDAVKNFNTEPFTFSFVRSDDIRTLYVFAQSVLNSKDRVEKRYVAERAYDTQEAVEKFQAQGFNAAADQGNAIIARKDAEIAELKKEKCPAILMHGLAHNLIHRILENSPDIFGGDVGLALEAIIAKSKKVDDLEAKLKGRVDRERIVSAIVDVYGDWISPSGISAWIHIGE